MILAPRYDQYCLQSQDHLHETIQKNTWIRGKTINSFCITLMHLLTLHCLFLNVLWKPNGNKVPASIYIWHGSIWLFSTSKIKEPYDHRLTGRLSFCTISWKKFWLKCFISNRNFLKKKTLMAENYFFFQKLKFQLFFMKTPGRSTYLCWKSLVLLFIFLTMLMK